MKQFNGYDDAKKAAQNSGGAQLPAGAYICKIMAVRYEAGQDDASDRIAIQFDIAEGEQKDFFKKQYDATTSEDKKWKGKTQIYVPKDDGSEKDSWTKNKFAKWTNAFEQSNDGYSWDWDESKWKDKKIGIVFGPTGTIIDKKEVVYIEAHQPCTIKEVSEGTFWKKGLDLVKKKGFTGTKSNSNNNNGYDFVNVPEGTEEEIPF